MIDNACTGLWIDVQIGAAVRTGTAGDGRYGDMTDPGVDHVTVGTVNHGKTVVVGEGTMVEGAEHQAPPTPPKPGGITEPPWLPIPKDRKTEGGW